MEYILLFYVMRFACLYILSLKTRFELEITNGKANRVSFFFDFAPTFGLTAQPFNQSQILIKINHKRAGDLALFS